MEVDDNLNEDITVNYVDADNSWTLVQRCKKKQTKRNNQEEKWNKQQKENFLRFGDIYQGEPYKNYRNVNVGPPVANIPLQQQVVQPPVVQPPIPAPAPAQPQPAAALAPQLPQGIIAPPPNPLAQGGQLNPRLEAIPEEGPFQKKTKKSEKTKLNRKEQVTAAAPPLPPLPPPMPLSPQGHTARPSTHQIKENEEVPSDLKATLFLTTFDVWPFNRMQILPDGSVRYRLAREEKEQLKFLGLKNFFNTSWPKPDPHRSVLGRCKRI